MATNIEAKTKHTPGPWEYVPSDEHHGPYITGPFGGDIADFYVMSKPDSPSTLNGGPSKPIHHMGDEADSNAALVARLVNLYIAGREMIARQAADIRARGMIPANGDWGLTENEIAGAMMMNGMLDRYEAMLALLKELIDIEGPQPGTRTWGEKVKALIAKVEGP